MRNLYLNLVILTSMAALMLFPTNMTRALSLAKPGCQERCGNITVPYPFGIGSGCYLHESFQVSCTKSSSSSSEEEEEDAATLRFVHNSQLPILEISMGSVRVIDKAADACNDTGRNWLEANVVRAGQHFSYSQDRNVYMAVGCSIKAAFEEFDGFSGKDVRCQSLCMLPSIFEPRTCMGFNGCCKQNIQRETGNYRVRIDNLNVASICAGAFIAEKDYFPLSSYDRKPIYNIPVVLNWVIDLRKCPNETEYTLCGNNTYCTDSSGRGYTCRCLEGYEGNPYLPTGCKAINECLKQSRHHCRRSKRCINTPGSHNCTSLHRHKQRMLGIIAAVIGMLGIGAIGYLTLTKHARSKKDLIKKKFFNRNGGNLLKHKISANKSCVIKIKIYTAEEMEKATNGFSQKRFLGMGGQGTVYKGMLREGTVVAIKKSNAVDEDQVERFVNELLILAQINHRNIVKLLGCCLEYEVPILVYEYLSNGTLAQHLHDGAEVSKFSWKDRIQIAREVAGAMAYLHSYASTTIFHRDIKPLNILFDENYKAVVSDFGLSRSVALNRTHLTTQVEGTFGYLDPEYFQSGQFTAKSDVYAFGVVLIELLTRRKSVSSRDSDGQGLIPRFEDLMKHNCVFEIVDNQVLQDAWTEDVLVVAKLAKRCMKRNAKKRPSMIEVVKDLDKLKMIVQLEVTHKCIIDDCTSTKR